MSLPALRPLLRYTARDHMANPFRAEVEAWFEDHVPEWWRIYEIDYREGASAITVRRFAVNDAGKFYPNATRTAAAVDDPQLVEVPTPFPRHLAP